MNALPELRGFLGQGLGFGFGDGDLLAGADAPAALAGREFREIVGADLVEFNPVRDPSGMTTTVAAKILKEILGKMIRVKALFKKYEDGRATPG